MILATYSFLIRIMSALFLGVLGGVTILVSVASQV